MEIDTNNDISEEVFTELFKIRLRIRLMYIFLVGVKWEVIILLGVLPKV